MYFAWAWDFQVGGRAIGPLDTEVQEATFNLRGVPFQSSVYQAKTPWVSKPDYDGPILIRGKRLDGKGTLRFYDQGPKPVEDFKLSAPNRTDSTHWSFWPSYIILSAPGCYGVQLDTLRGTDTVIFSVAPGN